MDTNKINLKLKKIIGIRAKKIIIYFLFPRRNNFLLFNYMNRAKDKKVNLNYWLESSNLGDALSPIIVDYMLSLKGLSQSKKVSECRHLYAVGSILTAGIQDCTVWGSGILNASLTYRLMNRKFDVRAVRGPITKIILMDYGYDVPQIFGDPAVLLPEIYNPLNIKKRYKYGLVLHKDQQVGLITDAEILIIDICTIDYHDFVDKICSVETVISSSLHGIIIAESYGVKAVLLSPLCDMLKYYDWYYSTNRYSFPIANTIDEGKNITPIELPLLDEMRSKLKKAFPYDIYQ
jgi:pyruvyltransferase